MVANGKFRSPKIVVSLMQDTSCYLHEGATAERCVRKEIMFLTLHCYLPPGCKRSTRWQKQAKTFVRGNQNNLLQSRMLKPGTCICSDIIETNLIRYDYVNIHLFVPSTC